MGVTTISEFFQTQIGRSLSPDEQMVLSQLSPQGVAKVNADFHRGIPATETLLELKLAYAAALRWQATLRSALPAETQAFLAALPHPPSTAEVVFLDCVGSTASLQQSDDDSVGSELEDGCGAFLLREVYRHALALSQGAEQDCHLSFLAPTKAPLGSLPLGTTLVTRRSNTGRPKVGLSPLVAWFRAVGELSSGEEVHLPSIQSKRSCPRARPESALHRALAGIKSTALRLAKISHSPCENLPRRVEVSRGHARMVRFVLAERPSMPG
eukprot:RCo014972